MSPLSPDQLLEEINLLQDDLQSACGQFADKLDGIHPNYRHSALNLIVYMALRRKDLRTLQTRLSELGLTSLGRCEAHVHASVEALRNTLCQLADTPYATAAGSDRHPTFHGGSELLEQHIAGLLGSTYREHDTHIMVTMPSEAATDDALVEELLLNGMNCMRINCAHDGPQQWRAMIDNLRRASAEHQRPCKISMDLGGPKLRTTGIQPQMRFVKIKPHRAESGEVLAPARVLLDSPAQGAPLPPAHDVRLCFDAARLASLQAGDELRFKDSRRARRSMQVVEHQPGHCLAELHKTAYVSPSTEFRIYRNGQRVGSLQDAAQPGEGAWLLVKPGEKLRLRRDVAAIATGEVGCTIPEVLSQIQPGERIWFDDGKIGGVIAAVEPDHIDISISYAAAEGSKLYNDKGINLPDSQLRLPALSSKDILDLAFVVEHADIVALSFANTVEDVRGLCRHLRRLGGDRLSVILKIETAKGFEQLAPMLLEAMQLPSCGVMVARGDLAIEVGFERLAEVQEEILWICEAAHVPAIWATQVLESLAKRGAPTRAEISDAALGHRADCVMLNKGEHIAQALVSLRDILERMEGHEYKKLSRLRPLHVAHSLFQSAPPTTLTADPGTLAIAQNL